MPKQIFHMCAVVLFLSCLPSVLHAQLCDNGFCFEIVAILDEGENGHVDVFNISTDKPVAELHLSIDSGDRHDDLTRWALAFPPSTLSPPPNVSSTLDFGSMTFDAIFSPAAPLPAGAYEVAFLDIVGSHGSLSTSGGRFSDGSAFSTNVFILPEPSTFALLAMVLPLLCCPFRARRSLRRQRTRSRNAKGTRFKED
ncbi:MAG: hypothetical protein IID44_01050 [Planctomycetes bacterium]|nr:hypothetical protein [Planctomycetota bacterium]